MKFTLEINCDNAAFAPVHDDASEADRYDAAGEEIRRMLRYIADCMLMDAGNRSGRLTDANGNRCGQWSISDDDEPLSDEAGDPDAGAEL